MEGVKSSWAVILCGALTPVVDLDNFDGAGCIQQTRATIHRCGPQAVPAGVTHVTAINVLKTNAHILRWLNDALSAA